MTTEELAAIGDKLRTQDNLATEGFAAWDAL